MNEEVKSRLQWLTGGVLFLLFGAFTWATIGVAFLLPEPTLAIRAKDATVALILTGACAFASASMFIRSGYTEHSRIIDSWQVRLYLVGSVVFAIVFVLAWRGYVDH